MLNIFIRILTILSFITLSSYWYITERTTEKSKPKAEEKISFAKRIKAQAFPALEALIFIQMIGVKILLIPNYPRINSFLGLIIVLFGLGICLVARKTLGDNWTNAREYQVKRQHELITKGIYAIIRHPIYFGLTLMLVGAEVVAGSYLAISFLAFFIVFYVQGKKEEKLFLAHFGKEYQDYMKHTKMLIPLVL